MIHQWIYLISREAYLMMLMNAYVSINWSFSAVTSLNLGMAGVPNLSTVMRPLTCETITGDLTESCCWLGSMLVYYFSGMSVAFSPFVEDCGE